MKLSVLLALTLAPSTPNTATAQNTASAQYMHLDVGRLYKWCQQGLQGNVVERCCRAWGAA